MTLVEFLTARLNEDEAAAKRAASIALRWVDAGSLLLGLTEEPNTYDLDFAEATNYRYDDALTHAARHDPARVLRDVERDRRILAEHKPYDLDASDRHGPMTGCTTCEHASNPYPCLTLRLLALPHDSHPDYDESWRP